MKALHPFRYLIAFLLIFLTMSCEETPIVKNYYRSWVYPGSNEDVFPLYVHASDDIVGTVPIASLTMYFKTIFTNFLSHGNLPSAVVRVYNYPKLSDMLTFIETEDDILKTNIKKRVGNNTITEDDLYYLASEYTSHEPFYGRNGKKTRYEFSAFGTSSGGEKYGLPAYRSWDSNYGRGAAEMFKITLCSILIDSKMNSYRIDGFYHEARGTVVGFNAFNGDNVFKYINETIYEKIITSNYFVFAYGARYLDKYDYYYSFEPGTGIFVADPNLIFHETSNGRFLNYGELLNSRPKAIIYDHGVDLDAGKIGIVAR